MFGLTYGQLFMLGILGYPIFLVLRKQFCMQVVEVRTYKPFVISAPFEILGLAWMFTGLMGWVSPDLVDPFLPLMQFMSGFLAIPVLFQLLKWLLGRVKETGIFAWPQNWQV